MVYLIAAIICVIAAVAVHRLRDRQHELYIDTFHFHPAVVNKFREVRSHLSEAQEQQVFTALRDYFQLCRMARRRMVAMPSQVVDDAWHAFILYTRSYEQFCAHAFGRFLHHTPAEAMRSPTLAAEGIKRAWRLACLRDGIDPRQPVVLPLLFSIDRELQIENGFYYVTNCINEIRRNDVSGNYCASHIGCGSGCAGDSGGDSSSADSGGGEGGGGCGGD